MNPPRVYMSSQTWTPPHTSQPTSFFWIIPMDQPQASCILHPASCIKHRLVILFLHDSIHVSMPFSQIIPPSPSPSESKSPFYTSVTLLLSCIQCHHYHLSKFHIYVLVYCIGVFLSGLLPGHWNNLDVHAGLFNSHISVIVIQIAYLYIIHPFQYSSKIITLCICLYNDRRK